MTLMHRSLPSTVVVVVPAVICCAMAVIMLSSVFAVFAPGPRWPPPPRAPQAQGTVFLSHFVGAFGCNRSH
jgi:hypothetical protein